jgi:hypothetical protein
LYPATLLKLFVVSRSFGVEFFMSLRSKIMSSANRDTLTVSLPVCIPFISSSYLIALARNFRIMLNRSGDSGHPCLFPDFRGNSFSFSPLSMMLAIDLLCIAIIIIMVRYILFLVFSELWLWNGVVSCWRLFLHLLRWSSGFCLCFY